MSLIIQRLGDDVAADSGLVHAYEEQVVDALVLGLRVCHFVF
jgi:hypothetical protein